MNDRGLKRVERHIVVSSHLRERDEEEGNWHSARTHSEVPKKVIATTPSKGAFLPGASIPCSDGRTGLTLLPSAPLLDLLREQRLQLTGTMAGTDSVNECDIRRAFQMRYGQYTREEIRGVAFVSAFVISRSAKAISWSFDGH